MQMFNSPTSLVHVMQIPKLYSGQKSSTALSSHFQNEVKHELTTKFHWDAGRQLEDIKEP